LASRPWQLDKLSCCNSGRNLLYAVAKRISIRPYCLNKYLFRESTPCRSCTFGDRKEISSRRGISRMDESDGWNDSVLAERGSISRIISYLVIIYFPSNRCLVKLSKIPSFVYIYACRLRLRKSRHSVYGNSMEAILQTTSM